MSKYQYEWWNCMGIFPTGPYTCEVKARNRDNAIKKFIKDFPDVIEFMWETLVLDRTGYQRRF